MRTNDSFPPHFFRAWFGGWLIVAAAAALANAQDDAAPVDFGRQVRPLLADRCFICHGPDDAKREAGLRLDLQDSVFAELESGTRAVVPNKPAESSLVARITSRDPELQMPPPDQVKQLSPDEIATLVRWVEQGAQWRQHWSLTPPVVRPPQLAADSAWPRNEIDRYVLARLQQAELQPAEPADQSALLRRVTFDLTGLPPTVEEVDAFLADDSAAAYELAVDRLLQSERYGEHLARFWLDAARYGDTHGLHLDNYREMWPYRDWVVRAFNRNLPFDQFLVEQVAGDLLPDPTLDQIIATGFVRCHVTTNEGGSIKEEVYVRNVVDRVTTFGTVFLGVTFECSRCHDHKFDPYTMRDFYALFAYFNSLDGDEMDGNRQDSPPVVKVPSGEQQEKLGQLDTQIAQLESRLREPWTELDQLQQEWETRAAAPAGAAGEGPAAATPSEAIVLGDWHSVGPFTENRRYLVNRQHGPEGKPIKLDEQFKLATGEAIGWVRHPEWSDGAVHQGLPGAEAANFLYRSITSPVAKRVTVSLGSDDGIKVYLNGKQVLSKDVERAAAAEQETLELPLSKGENQLVLKIMNFGGGSGFYFAVKSEQVATPPEILTIVRQAAAQRSAEQQAALREFFRNKVASFGPLDETRNELEQSRKARAEIDRQVPTTLIFREAAELKPSFVLKRGEYDQQADQVERRTPAVLPPLPSGLPNNRLGLAKWLVDPGHPLTARVTVNRLWQQCFGTGLVKSAEDFGSQGEPPSHPELLDWLALQFIADGWDMKQTLKRIVMSAAYRQSARVTPELQRLDPANRLLARGPRYRLDAEMLRDQALACSGLLVNRLGGPGVKPPQPGDLWFAVGYSGSNTVHFVADESPEKIHRRTLYTFIKRTAPPPQMSILDGPSREYCVTRRERTNTPLQALMMFNDLQFVDAARALAERVLREGGDTIELRAERMFRLCASRRPSGDELTDLAQAYREELAHFQAHPPAAEQLASTGFHPREANRDAAEVAAWTMVANLVLNLDEVLNK